MPRISVIIPCYNRASLIGETIENMLMQTVAPHELIVVDDGSTDDSADVIASFGERVTMIRQTNQGPGAARNAGFSRSTGDLIQFMDSDDLASKDKLALQVKAIQDTGADFAYGAWIRCLFNGKKIRFDGEVLQAGPVPASRSILEWFLDGWSLVFQNCLFTRTILERAGVYRTDLMPSEDSEYFIRILLAGARAVHVPGSLVFYREHQLNKITSTGTSAKQRANDWTHFLDITGRNLESQINTFSPHTLLNLAVNVKQHLDFCRQHDCELLQPGHPYAKLLENTSQISLRLRSLKNRVRRKNAGSADWHIAFKKRRPDAREAAQLAAIGYELE